LQADVDKAVEAARKAFDIRSPWRLLEPAARGNLMRKFADLLRRDIDYLSVRFYLLLLFTPNINHYLEIRNTK
jgi:acyl-CoA reductase-like NAD-dependent aldehyde dehydrogenase